MKSMKFFARPFATAAGWTGAALVAVLLGNKVITQALGLLVATLSSLALAQQAWIPPTKSSFQLDPQITATSEVYRTAVLKSDLPTLMTLYRDDALEMPFFRPPLKGRNAIRQFYKEQFQGPAHVIAFTFVPFETSVHGDVAYDVGTYARGTKTPQGITEGSGSYFVLLKRSGVQWKIAYITYTCNPPRTDGPSSAGK